MTERRMQKYLIAYCMYDVKHQFALPNSKAIIGTRNEADLISITKSGLIHEWEIKLSMSDYKADFKKKKKHTALQSAFDGTVGRVPNYFWYATYGLTIEPPEYAGWVVVNYNAKRQWYEVELKRKAKRLHGVPATQAQYRAACRHLSFRLLKMYQNKYKT